MIDAPLPNDASLPALLAHRARHASDRRLALDSAAGLLVASGALALRPPGWLLIASAAGCFAAFGAWGIADRELGERSAAGSERLVRALRAGRAIAAIVGLLAALTLLLTAVALGLGTWIS